MLPAREAQDAALPAFPRKLGGHFFGQRLDRAAEPLAVMVQLQARAYWMASLCAPSSERRFAGSFGSPSGFAGCRTRRVRFGSIRDNFS